MTIQHKTIACMHPSASSSQLPQCNMTIQQKTIACLKAWLLAALLPAAYAQAVYAKAEVPADPGTGTEYEAFGNVYEVMPSSLGYTDIGVASWYGTKFHGRLTSLGETYDMLSMTAAHRLLPLPTMVRVTNLDNGRQLVVRVNDRGPFHDDRIIDLSYGAARLLGFESKGTAPVVVEALDYLNYPGQAEISDIEPVAYLQLGAWSDRDQAETMLKQTQTLLDGKAGAKMLEIEGEPLLFKVWVGPLVSEADQQEVGSLVKQELGEFILVQVPSQ